MTVKGQTMTKSNLCTYVNITSNKSNGRGGNSIRKITPHYMCAHWTGRGCADYFASTSRQASSNYCIGYDGDVAMSVDEDDRAWTSSSGRNDRQAITIECANNTDSSLPDATYQSLVKLCADVCQRYGIEPSYDGTQNATFTEHRMFASTDCPGEWLHAHMGQLVEDVKAAMAGGTVSGHGSDGSGSEAPSAAVVGKEGTGFGGTYRCTVDYLRVRDAPSLSAEEVTHYSNGETVTLDDWYCIADGYVWGRYTGGSGYLRYIAVGKPTGGYDPGDYLVKEGAATAETTLSAGVYRIVADALRVRTGPGTEYGRVATYSRGETVELDGTFVSSGGYVWGRYTGGSGYKRWIAVETDGGEKYAERV